MSGLFWWNTPVSIIFMRPQSVRELLSTASLDEMPGVQSDDWGRWTSLLVIQMRVLLHGKHDFGYGGICSIIFLSGRISI